MISSLVFSCFSANRSDNEGIGVERGSLFKIPTILEQALDTDVELAFENFKAVFIFVIILATGTWFGVGAKFRPLERTDLCWSSLMVIDERLTIQ